MEPATTECAEPRLKPAMAGAPVGVDGGLSASPASAGTPQRSDPRRRLWLAVLLVIATAVAYGPAWSAGFVWDDDAYVTENPLITSEDGWSKIWFSTEAPSQYFPLVYSSFRLQHSLWGWAPAGYHAVNILLHAVNALLVWLLLTRWRIAGAWFAAAVFALHPVQVESVAWVTELKNVQSLFFSLLTALAWTHWREVGKRASYVVALVGFALALFSKTTACTLPVVLWIVDAWQARAARDQRHAQARPYGRGEALARALGWGVGSVGAPSAAAPGVVARLPFFALAGIMGVVTILWERFHQGTAGDAFALPVLDRVLIAGRGFWFYLGKLAWPADLSFSYPLWRIDVGSPLAYAGAVGVVVLAGLLAAGLRRSGTATSKPGPTGSGLAVAGLIFALTLTPTLGFVMLYTFRYSFVADHYQYVAMLAPVVAIAAGATAAAGRWSVAPWMRRGLAAGVLVTLGTLTFAQARNYVDAETLWRATLRTNPNSFLAHANLAAALLARDDTAGAQKAAEAALATSPTGPDLALVRITLGNLALRRDDPAGAAREFRAALTLEPTLANGHNNLGTALLALGENEAAAAALRAAIELQPRHASAHYNLGHAWFRRGDYAAAADSYRAAIALSPRDADARHDFATALALSGRVAEAAAEYRTALALRPDFGAARENLERLTTAYPEYRGVESLGYLRTAP